MLYMDLMEAMKSRHAVRRYLDRPIEAGSTQELTACIRECNAESGLHIQLCLNEPEAFSSRLAQYGSFENVKNYIAIVGQKERAGLEEACGYYGEKVVLKAAQLGLNTCWVAVSYNKERAAAAVDIASGEKLCIVIALGYGATQGTAHNSKPLEAVCRVSDGAVPDWFRRGVEAAMLAPTAMNQQKFLLTLNGNTVKAEAPAGMYTQLDLGIVKCHFEIGTGTKDWHWE